MILDTHGAESADGQVLSQELVQNQGNVPVDETLLVVDASSRPGRCECLKHGWTVGIDGIITTKTDGDTRGGAALGAERRKQAPSVPGHRPRKAGRSPEGYSILPHDLRILGMGDVFDLIEREGAGCRQ